MHKTTPHKLKMTLMAKHSNSTQATLMAALSTLSPPHLSHLTHSISSLFHRHRHRIVTILSSPILFSLSLRHLHSFSLHQKSLLLARHLHSSLLLLHHFTRHPDAAPPPPSITLRDLDATLLLLLLCELHQHNPNSLNAPPSRWRMELTRHLFNSLFSLSRFGEFSECQILVEYVESVSRCWSFVGLVGFGSGQVAAAATEAVVALPWVEVSDGGEKCVICTEEMKRGRQVCELPCGHLFHWSCILRWFKKRNTCPCCRHRLPTGDVRRDIQRIMEDLSEVGGCDIGRARLYRECL